MSQPFPFSYERAQVPVGIGPGNSLYWALENSVLPTWVPPLDFTTVTSVYFSVTRVKDASTDKWTATSLTTVTPSGLVAVFAFGSRVTGAPYECYIDGIYYLRPWAITASAPQGVPFDEFPLYVLTP